MAPLFVKEKILPFHLTRIMACYIKEMRVKPENTVSGFKFQVFILRSASQGREGLSRYGYWTVMIYGIGVDLVKIARIQAAMETWGERFQKKIFTETEQTFCLSKPHPTRYWAMRFAAKEAFSKAVGLGMRQGVYWKDIEVTANAFGKPELILHGRAREICLQAGIKNSFLTLTDEEDYAMAVVVLEG